MSIRTTIAAVALAGFGLAGGAVAAASGALAAAAPPAAVLTTFGNPHVTGTPSTVTLADTTDGGPQSQGIPIPH
ncbi:MAG TPA: hypothetical protein VGY96_06395 [Streptosporangiaceae bacterium]|jgi:hypothetical protein|nr:hypothetical protein [Streptosporangiaceae bacterium]